MSNYYYLFIILFIYLILNKREKNFVKKVILFLANKKVNQDL